MSNSIRVVVFPSGDQWVAQCLEHDICSQAPDLEQLHERLEVTLEAERRDGLDRIPAAPKRFFDLWDKRSGFAQSSQADGVMVEMALYA